MALSHPITVDGIFYPHIHVVSITRNFQVLDGENAGRVLDRGRMNRDIIGTFYNYSIEIDSDESSPAEYDAFYEMITAPVDSHIIEVPYGQTIRRFEAYVAQGSDTLEFMGDTANRWGNLTVNIIATEAQRAREA